MSASLVGSEMCIRDSPNPMSAETLKLIDRAASATSSATAKDKRRQSVTVNDLTPKSTCATGDPPS
eukprot:11441911-Alexandrium_andersonii.AAC.1